VVFPTPPAAATTEPSAPSASNWLNTLTLQNSPFWTLTPSYTQNIHVSDLRILAPMDQIGNTDGVNLDSCRNALVENLWIQNSDDGICIKSGLNGFGLNLAIPTENVLIRNITCPPGGRGGFAIGSEMSGGLRNITYRDSTLHGTVRVFPTWLCTRGCNWITRMFA
jgi:polygalacturonase